MTKLDLSDHAMQTIQTALMELPYRMAAPVFQEINRQLEMARAPQAAAQEELDSVRAS
jgi:hypothetical protein